MWVNLIEKLIALGAYPTLCISDFQIQNSTSCGWTTNEQKGEHHNLQTLCISNKQTNIRASWTDTHEIYAEDSH